ncbi:MAG: ATP-binding cassette domain-containing protein [Collinsella sp.]
MLFSGTIAENLRWGDPNATDGKSARPHIWPAPTSLSTASLGYDTWIEQGGSNAGGQKQRLCIARALLRRPKILILTTPRAPSTPRPTPRSARAWRATCPTRPNSSSPSVLAPCRMLTASSSWRAAAQDIGTMTSCSRRARSTARPLPRKQDECRGRGGGETVAADTEASAPQAQTQEGGEAHE